MHFPRNLKGLLSAVLMDYSVPDWGVCLQEALLSYLSIRHLSIPVLERLWWLLLFVCLIPKLNNIAFTQSTVDLVISSAFE